MSIALTEKQEREIEAFWHIANENGATITLSELKSLAAIDASEQELKDAILSNSKLGSRFTLESGYVLERSEGPSQGGQNAVREAETRRARARANLKTAGNFGRVLLRGAVLVSVSGANSYLSAAEKEDIDFFCVTKTDGMWPFVLKALIVARLYRATHSDVPDLCFSCVMDKGWATEAFRSRQKPIFARDALTAKVIGGTGAYRALLEEARWMGSYFPTFYGMRLRQTGSAGGGLEGEVEGEGSAVLNALLYHTLGSFLRLKSWALNRKFTKAGRHSAIFAMKIGKGHYIYESNKYRHLRNMYEEIEEGVQ